MLRFGSSVGRLCVSSRHPIWWQPHRHGINRLRGKFSVCSLVTAAAVGASTIRKTVHCEDRARQKKVIFEVCVDSVMSGLAAEAGGADRVELCDNLIDGGTTPSIGMVRILRKNLSIPIHVIIRPRGGDFLYSALEMETMLADINAMKAEGVDGIVIGVLEDNGCIDRVRTKTLIDCARPLSITFHRAFDMTPDYEASLEACLELDIDRILTSGQQASAADPAAKDVLRNLVRKSEGKCKIMVGAGVTSANAAGILRETGVQEVHASTGRVSLSSQMRYRPSQPIFMGAEKKNTQNYEFELKVVIVENVQAYVSALRML